MKREAMLKAWELFRKGFGTFAESLKKAWALVKKLVTRTVSEESAINCAKSSGNANIQKFIDAGFFINQINRKYPGPKQVTYGNFKAWTKGQHTRIYADKYLDGIYVGQIYVD